MDPKSLCSTDEHLKTAFVWIERSIFVLCLPLNSLNLWCIHTDKTTRIKWILFLCQFWFFFCDIIISIFSVPVLYLPFPAFSSVGILTQIGVPVSIQLYIIITFFGVMTAITIHLFLRRHQTIVPRNHKFALHPTAQLLLTVFIYLFFGGGALPFYLFMSDDKVKSIANFQEKYPCVYRELWAEDTVIIAFDNFVPFSVHFIVYISLHAFFINFLVTDTFRSLRQGQKNMSKSSQAHVQRSLRTIVLQIAITFLFLIIPIGIMAYLFTFNVYNQLVCCIAVAGASFHATVGTIVGISLNRQYRLKIMKLLHLDALDKRWAQVTVFSANYKVSRSQNS